jgi:hypothetical protein
VQLNLSGNEHPWIVSTAPTVDFGDSDTPVDPTTDTTRPTIAWDYADPENDAQATYILRVFTDAVYGGGGFDPETSIPVWETSGVARETRGAVVGVDLVNDTYRAYVKVTDTSGLASGWAFVEWTQNVTPPATPTVACTVLGNVAGVQLDLNVNPAGLPVGTLLAARYVDADEVEYHWVWDGVDLTPDGSGDAQVIDRGARFGVERSYEVIAYVPESFIASPWSASDEATITDQSAWVFTSVSDGALGGEVRVNTDFKERRPIVSGVFNPAGRTDAIIVSDGEPKSPAITVSMWALDASTRAMLTSLLESTSVLLLRDVIGRAWFVKPVDAVERTFLHAAKVAGETSPIRDAHKLDISLQSTTRPTVFTDTTQLSDYVDD